MRDRLNRAKVPVAPGVLVQLIVATPHDAPRDEVFYAAACCVASRFDGAHRGLANPRFVAELYCGVLRWREVNLEVSCVETQQVLCFAIQL